MEIGLHIFVASATARGILAAALALVWMPAFGLDAGETLRVMTFNVRGCKDMTDNVNVQQTANRILAEDPDVCGIYECNASRSAELAEVTGLKLFFANDECILSKEEEETPGEDVQGAVWIGTNGLFNVWTAGGWIPVEAEGVTPQTGVEYTFRVVFNYAAGPYSVYVKTGLTGFTGFTRLRENNPVNPVNPVQNFPLAASSSRLTSIGFDGDGWLRSIFGNFTSGFSLRLRCGAFIPFNHC